MTTKIVKFSMSTRIGSTHKIGDELFTVKRKVHYSAIPDTMKMNDYWRYFYYEVESLDGSQTQKSSATP
jgi:hypothetical protein